MVLCFSIREYIILFVFFVCDINSHWVSMSDLLFHLFYKGLYFLCAILTAIECHCLIYYFVCFIKGCKMVPFHCTAFSPPFKVEFRCLLLSLLWTAVTQLPQTSILSLNISLFTSFSFYIAICLGGCIVYPSHFWTPQVWCLLGVKRMLTQWAKHLLKSAEVQWL